MSRRERIPSLRLHRPSGRAVATFNSTDIYFGAWGIKASQKAYDAQLKDWLVNGRRLAFNDGGPSDLTVAELFDRFLMHAKEEYVRPDSSPTTELSLFKDVMKIANSIYGDRLAKEFTPLALKACRIRTIEKDWNRNTINKAINRLRLIWKWGVVERLIDDAMVHHALTCVKPLKAGRQGVRESTPVQPVDDAVVEKTLQYCSPVIKAMVQVQRLTGARPGEVTSMQTGDIDRKGAIWIYAPRRHKNTHLGHDRKICIGPKAQAVLTPYLSLIPEAYCFSPAESERLRREEMHAQRKTPLNMGNVPGSNVKRHPKWKPRDHYDPDGYARAIRRACAEAFMPPQPLGRADDESTLCWRTRLGATN
jgi:integrase